MSRKTISSIKTLYSENRTEPGNLVERRNILQHCVSQSGYIMTASLDGKDHLFTDYLISIQFYRVF